MIGRLVNPKGAKSGCVASKHFIHALYLRERLEMLRAWEDQLLNVLDMAPRSELKAVKRIQLVPSLDDALPPDISIGSGNRGTC